MLLFGDRVVMQLHLSCTLPSSALKSLFLLQLFDNTHLHTSQSARPTRKQRKKNLPPVRSVLAALIVASWHTLPAMRPVPQFIQMIT